MSGPNPIHTLGRRRCLPFQDTYCTSGVGQRGEHSKERCMKQANNAQVVHLSQTERRGQRVPSSTESRQCTAHFANAWLPLPPSSLHRTLLPTVVTEGQVTASRRSSKWTHQLGGDPLAQTMPDLERRVALRNHKEILVEEAHTLRRRELRRSPQ